MLRVDVTKALGEFRLAASFTAPARGVTALYGRSGSGKTTLVNLLAGLLRPDSGSIALGDETLDDSAAGRHLPPERRRLGYVFQDARLFPHLSVEQNLLYGLRRAPAAARWLEPERVDALLELAPLHRRAPATLSGGERQRVALGRALLAQPRLLLLDEPLASLDQGRKEEVLPFLERLRDDLGLPMVYVSHAMPEVVRLADYLVLLDAGRVAATGSVGELLGRLDLQPLTGRYEAGAMITATLVEQDERYGLSRLDLGSQALWIGRLEAPVGARLRLRIRARDVALARERLAGLSIQNQLAGTIEELRGDGAFVDVALAIDGQRLWSRVTTRAADQLGLTLAQPVWALVRTVAVERQGVARLGPSDG